MYKVNKDLVESTKRLREKYRAFKRGAIDFQDSQAEQFRPIIEPLKELVVSKTENNDVPSVKKEVKDEAGDSEEEGDEVNIVDTDEIQLLDKLLPPHTVLGPTAVRYLYMYFSKPNLVDKTHGIHAEAGQFKIGNSIIGVNLNDLIINGKTYDGTKGLWQLVTLKTPKKFTETDRRHYEEIVKSTYAHRQNYRPEGNPLSSTSKKYKQFIKPILEAEKFTGSGLKLHIPDRTIEYVYWNNVNELVDRLRVLIMSREAGNTGLDNEIESIIEELREEKIIA